MLRFGKFAAKFYDWRVENNFSTDVNNNIKYMWSIPQAALDQWKTELEPNKERFTDQEYESYQSMFELGHSLLGINIAKTTNDNIVTLYVVTEKEVEFTVSKVLTGTTTKIVDGYTTDATLPDGSQITLPFLIKPNSLYTGTVEEENATVFDCKDTRSGKFGTIIGKGFVSFRRDHNMLGEESWLGTIDYTTGNLHLIRYNPSNEEAFIKNYKAAGSAGSSSSSSSGSGSGSGSSTAAKAIPYEYADLSGIVNILTEPINVVFSYDISDSTDSSLQETEDIK